MKMPYRTLLLCFLFAVVSLDAPASSAETSRWQGLWQTADEWGSAYTIDIRADGTATADYGDGWVGRWHKEYGNNVVIEWNSGVARLYFRRGYGASAFGLTARTAWLFKLYAASARRLAKIASRSIHVFDPPAAGVSPGLPLISLLCHGYAFF